jgi:hypothetical protein
VDQFDSTSVVLLRLDSAGREPFPLDAFVRAVSALASLLDRIAEEQGLRDHVEWLVSDVRLGSLTIELLGRSRPGTDPAAVLSVLLAAMTTLDAVQERLDWQAQRRLRYEMLELIRDLAGSAGTGPVVISAVGREILIDAESVERVSALLAKRYRSIGSIEGRIKTVSVAGPRPSFSIEKRPDGYLVTCFCDAPLLEVAKSALGSRVWVSGEITERFDGREVAVEVSDIEVARRSDELPQAGDIRGIISHDPESVWGRDAIRARYE